MQKSIKSIKEQGTNDEFAFSIRQQKAGWTAEEKDTASTRCIHPMDTNLCATYDNRPDICNVDKMYGLVYSIQMSEDECLKLNIEGCKELKKKFS